MGEVINLADATAPKVTTDEYFGGCPHCGGCTISSDPQARPRHDRS